MVAPMRRAAFFMPFQGCERRCVYCDQIAITSDAGGGAHLSPQSVASKLAAMSAPVELCYFGGSFARQSAEAIAGYLEAVNFAPRGSAVTFSSYPGDFDGPRGDEIISILGRYPIGTIELGIPSLDCKVLTVCGRPDDPESIRSTLVRLRDAGFHLGVQLMTGLPGQSRESSNADLESLGALIRGDPWDLRIYPCLVLRGTALEAMYREGRYSPLTLDEAVREVGELLRTAERAGFNVIRVGLQESASLRASVVAGPWHPAFGELAISETTALRLAEENPMGPWRIDRRRISQMTGHGGRGMRRLSELTGIPVDAVRDLIMTD